MSSSTQIRTSYGVQTAKGTPATAFKYFMVDSESTTVETELVQSKLIKNGSRMKSAGKVAGGKISGSIKTEFMVDVADELLACAFWNDWETVDNKQILKLGDKRKYFTLNRDYMDVSEFHQFVDCVMDGVTIEVGTKDMVSLAFEFMALGYNHNSTTAYGANATAEVDAEKASATSIAKVKIGGNDVGICIQKLSFSLKNNTEVVECIGSDNLYGGEIHAKLAEVTQTATMAYGKESQAYADKVLTGEIASIEVPFVFHDKSYILHIPQIQVSGNLPAKEGESLTFIDFTFTGVNEVPYLEKA